MFGQCVQFPGIVWRLQDFAVQGSTSAVLSHENLLSTNPVFYFAMPTYKWRNYEVTVRFHSWWFLHFVASNIRALSCGQTNPHSNCFYFVSMLGLFCFSLVPTHLLSEIGCWDFIQVLYCCYMRSLRNWRVWWSFESYCHPLIFARCLHDLSPLSSCNIHSPKSHSWL